MAERGPQYSPYIISFNNPINYFDPDGQWPWPIREKYKDGSRSVVSGFYRNSNGNYHGAVDIAHRSSRGQLAGGEVSATHSGIVTVSQSNNETAGNWVVVTNGDLRTRYLHMKDTPLVKVGQEIKEGQVIGYVGSTGRSEAPHLHYEIQRLNEDGKWERINPVVGDPDKVNINDNVVLKDPQQIINDRDCIDVHTQQGVSTESEKKSPWQSLKSNWNEFRDNIREVRDIFKEAKNN